MKTIGVGDAAPDFTSTSQAGEPVSLADFRGRKTVVLFFYPRDGMPVCTKEASQLHAMPTRISSKPGRL